MNQQETENYYRDSPAARWIALVIVCIGSFLSPLALSSVNIAAPAIAKALLADAVYVSWIPSALMLANVVTLLPLGRLADIWGRRKTYLCGSILFTAGSALAALAHSIEWLLFCRVLQGVAVSMIFTCALAIISSVFSDGRRGTALGIIGTSVYLGFTCGPLIGGWLTDHYGWRSVFWFPIPLALVSIGLAFWRLKGEWHGPAGLRLDWIGSLLFAVAAGLLFAAVSNLPSSPAVLALVVAFVLLGLFVYQQSRASHPLVRFKAIWGNRLFSYSLLASIFMYAANYPLVFLLSLYLQYIKGMSSSDAGFLLVFQALVMAVVAPISGRISDRSQPRVIASTGCLLAAGGFVMLQWLGFETPVFVIGSALLILGLGFGLFTTPNNNTVMGSIPKEKIGVASSLLGMSRVIGNMLGTALVVMLVSIYIGGAQIEPQQYPELLSVIKIAIFCSLAFTLVGAYCSHNRGEV